MRVAEMRCFEFAHGRHRFCCRYCQRTIVREASPGEWPDGRSQWGPIAQRREAYETVISYTISTDRLPPISEERKYSSRSTFSHVPQHDRCQGQGAGKTPIDPGLV
jgi:hypothetical protein